MFLVVFKTLQISIEFMLNNQKWTTASRANDRDDSYFLFRFQALINKSSNICENRDVPVETIMQRISMALWRTCMCVRTAWRHARRLPRHGRSGAAHPSRPDAACPALPRLPSEHGNVRMSLPQCWCSVAARLAARSRQRHQSSVK